jgi:uncharacterized protein YjbI with pentapeptide repeats
LAESGGADESGAIDHKRCRAYHGRSDVGGASSFHGVRLARWLGHRVPTNPTRREIHQELGIPCEGAMPSETDLSRPSAQDSSRRVETQARADEPADVKAAREFVQDAASVASALWVSYLGIMVYIAIAVGAVTHVDLFLERPVKLPLLGDTPLPLLAFFILAPIAFIIWHAYTLLHFGILAEKVTAFAATPGYREDYLWRLPANIFLQLLVGPPALRKGRIGFVSAAIAWISLVIGPILLLLLIQIQFLPFHSWVVTSIHRAMIILDLVLLWMLWPVVVPNGKAQLAPERRFGSSWAAFPAAGATAVVLIVSGVLATFPGEWMEQYGGAKWIPPNWFTAWLGARDAIDQPVWTSVHDLLFNGPYDERNQRRRSLFSNTLVLPDFDALGAAALDESKLDATKQTIVRKWGHFEQAIFRGADLRKVNFENAHLEGASFYQAKMQRAQLYNANLEGADLYQAALQDASFNSARLGLANLRGADLRRADLFQAGLEGASLKQTKLAEANFGKARLQASSLDGASAQCADLKEADLRGATFRAANLQAASLKGAQMQGSSLEKAQLQGADLSDSKLGVARLTGANVWNADFAGADSNAIIAVGLEVDRPAAMSANAGLDTSAGAGDDPQCVGARLAQPRDQALLSASVPRTGKMGDSDQEMERQALADQLANLVCSARDEDVRSVVYGLIRDDDGGSIVRDAGIQAKRFFERILDSNCLAAAYLTGADKKAVIDLRSAILLSEPQR